MDRGTSGRRGRNLSVGGLSLVLLLSAGALSITGPVSASEPTSCRVKNLIGDTGPSSNLQVVMDAAGSGDTIRVRGVCGGNFVIRKDLTLVGRPIPGVPLATLDGLANGNNVLTVAEPSANPYVPYRVMLKNVLLTGADYTRANNFTAGGGVSNYGLLTLRGYTAVAGNTSPYCAGIGNYFKVRMYGHASITGNTATSGSGGGYCSNYEYGGNLIMNQFSTIEDNSAAVSAGGIWNEDRVVMNDYSAVSSNASGARGGGILSFGPVVMTGNATVTGNTADSGAGIELWSRPDEGSYDRLLLKDKATIVNNTARSVGGGLYASLPTNIDACEVDGPNGWTGQISPNAPDDPPTVDRVTCR